MILETLLMFAGAVLVLVAAAAGGCLVAPRTPLPAAVRFCTGAVLVSTGIFALLACGIGCPGCWIAGTALLLIAARRVRAASEAQLPGMSWFLRAVTAAYAIMYLIYALAPEIQPDALSYHLRLVADYARLHAFSNRVAFYDVLPQGLEMLFVPAFAVGGPIAAKLVHFAFLLATIPLIREISSEAGIPDRIGSAAAALFFLAPVCGVAGTAAYTDAGLVCATSAVLYLLLRWRRERVTGLLLCAALNAGFCYAIKPTFGWVAIAATCFVAAQSRRIARTVRFALPALLTALPWMLRAWLLTGNPAAPFLNAWFPNPVATTDLEHHLAATYSAFRDSFHWRTALPDYTITGGNQGLLGAAFLLLPLALFSLRKKPGRWLLGASAILALPILANTGTRFLLPALVPMSIAFVSVLPAPLAVTLVALQAITAAPPVLAKYDSRHEWHLGPVPLQAALGFESEPAYLARTVPDYAVARMLTRNTGPSAKILACTPLPEAWIPREVLTWWHSVQAQRFTDALHFAHMSHGTRARLLSWRWNTGDYRALRLTALTELRIVEASFATGNAAPQSWQLFRPGDSLSLPTASGVTGADVLIWPGDQARESSEALSRTGAWDSLESRAERCARNIDLRRDATAYIRRSGYPYILIAIEGDAFAPIGSDMLAHPAEWGVEPVSSAGHLWLFRLLPNLL